MTRYKWADRFWLKLGQLQGAYGITDTELAKIMRVGRNTLWRWKQTRTPPSVSAITNVLIFYQLNLTEWFEFQGPTRQRKGYGEEE